MRINGQCHCGKIELEGTEDEANVIVLPLCGLSDFQWQPLPYRAVVFCKGQDFKIKGIR